MRTNPTMNKQAPNSVICVLGMHRSGTSCLMGSLQKAGLHLGKHHTWNRYNLKGNRENQDIVDLNEAVLQYSGGSWDNPPARVQFSEEHLQQAHNIVNAFPEDSRWGFKDPRALLTLPLWDQVLNGRYQRVGIFRHPLAVAASLGFRQGIRTMPEQQGLELWHAYNRKLLQEYKRQPFPLLCFDWEESRFHEQLNTLHEQLSLPALAATDQFYTAELKNYESQDLSIIPWKHRRLYSRLRALVD
jgi:hypothetical protein